MQKEITFDKLVRWVGTALLVFAVLYMVNYLSSVLLPFFVAWLFAYLLYPIVKFVEDKARNTYQGRCRGHHIVHRFGRYQLDDLSHHPPMIEQFQKLYDILTHWMHKTTHTNNISEWIALWISQNQSHLEQFFKSPDFTNILKSAQPKLFNIVGQTASILISIVASLITLLYTFFILQDYEYLSSNWVRIFPAKNRPFWNDMKDDVARELNNYIRGKDWYHCAWASCFA
jgi:predicted PurR-regulated permease PerM